MNISNFLSKIKDERKARGRRYHLYAILRLIVCGLLCGANNVATIHRWGKQLTKETLANLGFRCGKLICYSNLTIVLRKIEPDSLAEVMRDIMNYLSDHDKNHKIIHIDGKFLRNSNCFGDKVYSQILTAFNEQFRATVGYQKIEGRDEFGAMLKLLEKCNIKGAIITADATFSNQEILEIIVTKEANFAIALKGNEANLLDNTKKAFMTAEKQGLKIGSFTEPIDLLHGRIEQRTIEVIDMAFKYLNGHKHIKQLCRITRTREKKNKVDSKSVETAYMITSLDSKFSPEYLLKLNRKHWSCENNLNWVKDNIFLEDKSTISVGNAPLVMSLLRSTAIYIIATISNKITETRELLNYNKNLLWKKLYSTFSCDF